MLHLLMLLGQECPTTEKLTEKLGVRFILIDCAFNLCRLLFIYCRLRMSTNQRLDPALVVLIGISCNIYTCTSHRHTEGSHIIVLMQTIQR